MSGFVGKGVADFLNERVIAKIIFVGLGCAMGAGEVMEPAQGLSMSNFPKALLPDFRLLGCVLLTAVLGQAIVLSVKGKSSASWAVLGLGSMLTALIMMLVNVIWYNTDDWRTGWLGLLTLFLLTSVLIYLGLKAAFTGAWWRVGGYAAATVVFMFALLPSINYSQFFYCSRYHIPRYVPSTESSGKQIQSHPKHQTGDHQSGKSDR